MRVAKARTWRHWKAVLVTGRVTGAAVIVFARLGAFALWGAWLGGGFAIWSGVMLTGVSNGWFGLGARLAGRQRERHGAFVLRGQGPRWLRFDGEFAIFGGAGYRARLRFTDLREVIFDAKRGSVRGSLCAVDGIDRVIEWRLSEARYLPLDRIDALERMRQEYEAWKGAQVTDRPSIAPPLTAPVWLGPAGVSLGILAVAFAVPLPGARPRILDLLWLVYLLALWQLAPKRADLRNAGWTFDDERPQPKRRPRGVA